MLVYCTLFPFVQALSHWVFTGKIFNKTVVINSLRFHNGRLRGSVIRKCVNDT